MRLLGDLILGYVGSVRYVEEKRELTRCETEASRFVVLVDCMQPVNDGDESRKGDLRRQQFTIWWTVHVECSLVRTTIVDR
jgi:hypothetical protein